MNTSMNQEPRGRTRAHHPSMHRRILWLCLLLGMVYPIPRSLAQGPPIQTDTPIMLGIQGRGLRTFGKLVRKEGLLREGEEIADPMGRSVTAFIVPVVIPYNLGTTFQLGAAVPFVSKSLDFSGGTEDRSGIGDMTLFAKQLLVQVDRKQETFRVALKLSAKFPTGSDATPLPLGTGSFDYGASAVAAWIKGRWGLYGEAIYVHNTSNEEVDYGDRIGINAALGFRAVPGVYDRYPSPQLNLYLELNGSVTRKKVIAGVQDPDSGGAILFLSPGIQYVGGRTWLVEASLQIPLVDDPSGTQLATDGTFSLGARVLLF